MVALSLSAWPGGLPLWPGIPETVWWEFYAQATIPHYTHYPQSSTNYPSNKYSSTDYSNSATQTRISSMGIVLACRSIWSGFLRGLGWWGGHGRRLIGHVWRCRWRGGRRCCRRVWGLLRGVFVLISSPSTPTPSNTYPTTSSTPDYTNSSHPQ